MALGLEKALEIPAEMWLNLQNQYDLDTAEIKSRESKSRFTFIRLLIESTLQNIDSVTEDDRKEMTRITSLLHDY